MKKSREERKMRMAARIIFAVVVSLIIAANFSIAREIVQRDGEYLVVYKEAERHRAPKEVPDFIALDMIRGKHGEYSLSEEEEWEYSRIAFLMEARVSTSQKVFSYQDGEWKMEAKQLGTRQEKNWFATFFALILPLAYCIFVSLLGLSGKINIFRLGSLVLFYAGFVGSALLGGLKFEPSWVLFLVLVLTILAGLVALWSTIRKKVVPSNVSIMVFLFVAVSFLLGCIMAISGSWFDRINLLGDYIFVLLSFCFLSFFTVELFRGGVRKWMRGANEEMPQKA